ncbi:MAG: endolytic transglycosylase MltG [Muribaculaceae bacterium]|nr:endolytic transglycosylase MltG [Muribaculaceae bacterium]
MEENLSNISPNPAPILTPENKRRKFGRTEYIIISALVVVIGVLAVIFLPLFTEEAHADTIIRIPRNATREMVADSVSKYLGEDFSSQVMKAAKLRGSDFSSRHGAYLIPEGTSAVKAEHTLSHGAQEPVTITINGFRLIGNLAGRLERRLDFSAEEFMETVADESLMEEYGLNPEQALSLFIDDSYQVYWSGTPRDLIKKVGAHYKEVWNEERRKKAEDLGLTPADVMTICSIVDEETNKIDEKGTVGRLYINRLQSGMKLQADPTVRYAVGDFTIKRVTGTHLKTESPFNTYLHAGVPPGPIRTTSVATIDAVLNSEPHDYMYMCAKEDFSGYHNFAATYSEHLDNARRYQKALDELGIK